MRSEHTAPRTGRLLLAVAVALACAGSLAFAGTPAEPTRVIGAPSGGAGTAAPAPVLAHSAPVALHIPAIGVHTEVLPLGLRPDGTVEVPPLGAPQAGWYENSPAPGELGPAVVLGHVDSARSGPGVFVDLPALLPGDVVTVARADGSTAAFRVTASPSTRRAPSRRPRCTATSTTPASG
ncbi:sortase domain-containing protein [Pseudonocardia nigra]|uniref:sortase domain-containing protein n=1 Tax=Pseudonocardia nigra TaxID=1921578 RepID=UPI001FE4B968|nr:sortase [Pseudonocardia nigra]